MQARIVLIHAVRVAMEPIESAFSRTWPEAELVNILEDSLSPDLEAAGILTPPMTKRIVALAQYGNDIGASAILFTCSAFGEAIEAAKATLSIPVLKPNEAMFEEALRVGSKIGLLATFGPSVPSMEKEFFDMAAKRGLTVDLSSVLVNDAMKALKAGDSEAHNRLLAEAALRLLECEVVMLAHFSTACALPSVSQVLGSNVLTSPDSAVTKLKSIIS